MKQDYLNNKFNKRLTKPFLTKNFVFR